MVLADSRNPEDDAAQIERYAYGMAAGRIEKFGAGVHSDEVGSQHDGMGQVNFVHDLRWVRALPASADLAVTSLATLLASWSIFPSLFVCRLGSGPSTGSAVESPRRSAVPGRPRSPRAIPRAW